MFIIQRRYKYDHIYTEWQNTELAYDTYEDAVLNKPFNEFDNENNGVEYKITEI